MRSTKKKQSNSILTATDDLGVYFLGILKLDIRNLFKLLIPSCMPRVYDISSRNVEFELVIILKATIALKTVIVAFSIIGRE